MYLSSAARLRLGKTLIVRCPRISLRLTVENPAGNCPQYGIEACRLFPTQTAKYTTSSTSVRNDTPKLPARIKKQSSAKHKSRSPVAKYISKRSSKPQAQPKGAPHKREQLDPVVAEPTKPDLRTSTQRIAYFREKLVKIRANMHTQVANLELVAKILGVEKDRLHPVMHCQHVLELHTSSTLQMLLQAIADKTPVGDTQTTQEDSTAIWLESRILAVQLWVIKRLLLRMELLELRDKGKQKQAKVLLQNVEAQISEMGMELAALRDLFHRVRPERIDNSLLEGWVKKFFVKEVEDAGPGDTSLALTTQPHQPSLSKRDNTSALASHSVLLENLAVVAAYSRKESATWKIERFLSRIEEVYRRIPRVTSRLDQLASELQVTEDRTHPLVSTKYLLELNTFGSLDTVLRVLRKRTPKNRLKLDQGMGEALWLDSRIPEVQLEVAKMRLWAYHLTTKSQNFLPHQKSLIRSIRGRIKVAHSLLQNSRKEFGSYGSRGNFEVGEGIATAKDNERT